MNSCKWLLIFYSSTVSFLVHSINVKLGLLTTINQTISGIRFETTAPAIDIAIERAKKEGLVPDVNFTILYAGGSCTLSNGTAQSLLLLDKEKIDALFGPMCVGVAKVVGPLMSFYNSPNFLWGPSPTSDFNNRKIYPLTSFLVPNTYAVGFVLGEVCRIYGWRDIGFVYTTSAFDLSCSYLASEIEASLAGMRNIIDLKIKSLLTFEDANFTASVFKEIKQRVRIVIVCMDTDLDMRIFMHQLIIYGMANDQFVYISTVKRNYKGPLWNDGLGNMITKAERYFLFLSRIEDNNAEIIRNFTNEVMQRAVLPPFNCTDCSDELTVYSYYLHDSVYYYLTLLDAALKKDPNSYVDGKRIMTCKLMYLEGLTGELMMRNDCTRNPTFYLKAFNPDWELQTYLKIKLRYDGADVTYKYTDESSTIWYSRGGARPLNMPKCGFNNNLCTDETWWKSMCAVAAVIVVIFAIGFYYLFRRLQNEKKRLMSFWRINFSTLVKFEVPKAFNASCISDRSSGTYQSSLDFIADIVTTGYELYRYNEELVLAKLHQPVRLLTDRQAANINNLKRLTNEHLNTFIGFCIDSPTNAMSIWKHNSRNSLRDVLLAKPPTTDAFFKFCLMRDIIYGIDAIHATSFIKYHGKLSSACCLINERWEVKISDYGLLEFPNANVNDLDLLWTAPEVLRDGTKQSKAGDIYSFAIICSEIMTEETAWNGVDDLACAKSILEDVKRGRTPWVRPSVDESCAASYTTILHLVNDCWCEHPEDRPSTSDVRTVFRKFKHSEKGDLMDHMFSILEEYAANMEEEVELKTKAVIQEKKKADLLLYRILPKQVAESLKLGEPVEPEAFDEVSIFYSDIVSFTVLAAKCTPLQVVTLLNDLYTMFDSIIDEHDVYKVETIGDAYLCASGVPRKNGHEHGREIANMALAIVESIKSFKVAHLPNEIVNVRIGMHTGDVVAGVVGLTMPRYCLFGDNLTIAAAMESNGKAGKIHLSSAANHLLTVVLKGFKTESRGEVMIKGKGSMETFWLLSSNSAS